MVIYNLDNIKITESKQDDVIIVEYTTSWPSKTETFNQRKLESLI